MKIRDILIIVLAFALVALVYYDKKGASERVTVKPELVKGKKGGIFYFSLVGNSEKIDCFVETSSVAGFDIIHEVDQHIVQVKSLDFGNLVEPGKFSVLVELFVNGEYEVTEDQLDKVSLDDFRCYLE